MSSPASLSERFALLLNHMFDLLHYGLDEGAEIVLRDVADLNARVIGWNQAVGQTLTTSQVTDYAENFLASIFTQNADYAVEVDGVAVEVEQIAYDKHSACTWGVLSMGEEYVGFSIPTFDASRKNGDPGANKLSYVWRFSEAFALEASGDVVRINLGGLVMDVDGYYLEDDQ